MVHSGLARRRAGPMAGMPVTALLLGVVAVSAQGPLSGTFTSRRKGPNDEMEIVDCR